MSTGRQKFRQREVQRAIRAARAAGAGTVEIEPDGKIVIRLADGAVTTTKKLNDADALLEKLKRKSKS